MIIIRSQCKKRNISYSLLVMIVWTGSYIITYNIIFGMKKGLTWLARQV